MSASLFDMLTAELRRFVAPLVDGAQDPWLLGHVMTLVGGVPGTAISAPVVAAVKAVGDFEQVVGALSQSGSLEDVGNLLRAANDAMTALRSISDGAGWEQLGIDLLEALTGVYLRAEHKLLRELLVLLGLVVPNGRISPRIANGAQLVRGAFSVDQVRFDKVKPLLADPLAALRAEYPGNGLQTTADANALAAKLFPRIGMVLGALNIRWRYGLPVPSTPGDGSSLVDHALTVFLPSQLAGRNVIAGVTFTLAAADRGDLGLIVSPFGTLTLSAPLGAWTVALSLSADVPAFAVGRHGLTLMPDAKTAEVNGQLSLALAPPASGPARIIGAPKGTRLEVGGAQLSAKTALSATDQSLALAATVSKSTLVVAAGDGDGLLRRLLPSSGLQVSFDLGLAWSNDHGLSLSGAAGLDATLPVALTVGPLSVPAVHLALRADGSGVTAEAALSASVSLGPLEIVIQGVGLSAIVDAPAAGGNLGVLDLSFGFKPPSGVGLSVDATAISGGGYLSHSGDQYSGALDLSVCGVAVKAFGLIETKLPGGAPGYSALIDVSTEFSPGFQIGYGFTLDGIGGLVGIHRTINIASVQSALWAHHFDGLLFPKDPVAAAPSLMTAIDSYFPAAEGRYLFGPLAKIGWGGGMVEALLGLIIEVPEPIKLLLLGEIDVQVPVTLPQLVLHIDFDGGIDFGQKLAFFDASLHDSKIESYPIGGDLAFRYGWGDSPVFALAIGGFHPHYQPPANFPALKRLSISIGEPGVTLTAQGYFALTSNSLQFGAKVELTAGTSALNVHGWLSFDALVEWNPFAFEFDLSAGVDLRAGSTALASVHLDGMVSGTAPWHVSADASISFLFFDISVHVDKQWGDTPNTLPANDPTPLVQKALSDPTAWSSVLPIAAKVVVTTSGSPSDAAPGSVLIDPAGPLRIAQRVAPLGQPIARFNGSALAKSITVTIDSPNVFGDTNPTPTTEEFAVAQFQNLSDDQNLSLPSFTALQGGIEIGGNYVDLGQSSRSRSVATSLAYETTIRDSATTQRPGGTYSLSASAQTAMNARLSDAPTPPPKFLLATERYIIAGSDLKARPDIPTDGSKLGALQSLANYLHSNPTARGRLQVVLDKEAA